MTITAYLRASSEEQKRRQTIRMQREQIEMYCERHDIHVSHWYSDDGISGTIPIDQRPAGSQLVADARSGDVRRVLVYKLDRLGREALVTLTAIDSLMQCGVEIVSITQSLDLKTPHGKFMAVIDCGVSGYERDTIVERAIDGNSRVARQNGWLGGMPPYGFRIERADRTASLVVHEQEAAIVRDIYRLIAQENYSCQKIADYLNARGVLTAYLSRGRTENLTKSGRVASGLWSASGVRNLIVSTTYKGIYRYGKRGRGGRDVIDRIIVPLVDNQTWERAQQVLHNNQAFSLRNTKRHYLLRGLIKCELCGLTYVGTTDGNDNSYYRCGGRDKGRGIYGANGERCPSKYLPAIEIESAIWEAIGGFLLNPGDVTAALVAQSGEQSERAVSLQPSAARLALEIAALTSERDAMLALFRKGRIDEPTLNRQLDTIERDERSLRLELSEVESQIRTTDEVAAQLGSVESMLGRLHHELESPPTWETMRRLVELLVAKISVATIEVEGKRSPVVTITYHFNSATVASTADRAYNNPSRLSLTVGYTRRSALTD